MSRNYCVYMHTCPNGKVYIGLTSKNPEHRWNNGNGYARQPVFYRAIQKYSWNNIKHTIIANKLTKEQAEQLEIELIARYNSTNREFGYNLSTGGNAKAQGIIVSNETREKLSNALSGEKNGMYGKYGKLNPMWGKTHSPEAKGKISECAKNRIGKKNGFYGKHHKEESKYWKGKQLPQEIKDKMSKAHDKNKKPIAQIDPKTGDVIAIYKSVVDAARHVNVSESAIIRVCKGKQHTSVGYKWMYVN